MVMGVVNKEFYFYILHDCMPLKDRFDYFKYVNDAFSNKKKVNNAVLELAYDINELKNKMDSKFLLDNNIDVRELYFTGEVKQITKENYEIILEDDKRILSKMSEKTKNLLTDFGFDLNGWHRPFKIEAKNKAYCKTKIKRKFDFVNKILWINK